MILLLLNLPHLMREKTMRNNIFAVIATYLLYGAIVAIIGYAIISIVLKPQNPLINAEIPQSTIDWFNGHSIDSTDFGGIYDTVARDSTQWVKYDDIDSMLCLEDEYFIFHYSAQDSMAERNKALVCQRYAHAAIPKGELVMKNYPYPNQLNGRKLPIYLANTEEDFRSICQQLGHGDPGTWAIGLYCFRYGGDKVYTDGIIISPRAWTVPDNAINTQTEDKDLQQTLWHEMNHFMYFTNWDFTQTSEPCLWFTEGLAEYFAENYDRLDEVGNYNRLSLTDDFKGRGNTEYWAGLSAYLCLEQQHGKANVYRVIQTSYSNSIDESLSQVMPGENLKSWDLEWHTFMKNNEYRKYKE